MQWSEAIREYTQALKPVQKTAADVRRILPLIDLTSLNDSDTESSIAQFCEKAQNPFGHVAAVCVYPQFARLVADQFENTKIKTATVVNFPHGHDSVDSVLIQISRALEDGAQEIDVVFPYERYMAGEQQFAHSFVASCKAACGDDVSLKVILETGALGDLTLIADASYEALAAGADFIKTSTGKIAEGASLDAAATMLLVIKHIEPQLKHHVGLKVSGGIREFAQAAQYVQLADLIMGKEWVTPETMRIGASKLVDEMLQGIE